ncbi:hypothetical protein EYD45_07370 [Hyunsoonleella flava]|uniref:Carrier domain-containing protein n=1 Tax=Hyunsoonleella flava TaxID=2527939 RepID=A0A4Q9FK50_9FLAO|nr:acyl carrier protein [Hyunsoonleella flava]TBN04429.1 hypothetical protein EYD45_07370 [Hyunsoonleella flava]
MTKQELVQKINELSSDEKKLLAYKLNEALHSKPKDKGEDSSKKIIAFLKANNSLNKENLKTYLRKELPEYMIPSSIEILKEIPLLPNGKVDKNSLLKIKEKTIPVQDTHDIFATSKNEIEQKLVKIWEDVLGFEPISTNDNFFEIGGDSILSIQIISRARNEGIDLKANQLFENQTIAELALIASQSTDSEDEKDDTKIIQDKLVNIWEEVLGFSPIHTNDNFFEIGGDSILSIQIIAKARKVGIELKVNHLFENQTIEALSQVASIPGDKDLVTNKNVELKGEVPLTPIQHWFFETHKKAPHYWNQIIELHNIDNITSGTLENISEQIIATHEALRLGFKNNSGKWTAFIKPAAQTKVFYKINVTGQSANEQNDRINTELLKLQHETDLAKDSLFKVLYFDCNSIQTNKIIIVAHHLVVDHISWNIIFNDIKSALSDTTSKQNHRTTIKDWSDYLIQLSKHVDFKELKYWESQLVEHQKLPTDYTSGVSVFAEDTTFTHSVELYKEQTENLVNNANSAYNTTIEDLLITALIATIGNWSNLERITLGIEKQGRTIKDLEMDFSNTVGWFTSYFPVTLNSINVEDTTLIIKTTKEQLRAIPNNGIGFGILKYLANNNEVLDKIKPKILFNYLGKSTKSHNKNALDHSFAKGLLSRYPESERHYEIEINAYITDGKLIANWSFAKTLYKESTAIMLANTFISYLNSIIQHCLSKEGVSYTPSDFSEVDLDQDDLDNLLSQF